MGSLTLAEKMQVSCPIAMNTFFHLEQKWQEAPRYRPLILLAGVIAAIASPILLLADATRWTYRSWVKGVPSADYHYFYSSKIFSDYVKQLREFLTKELEVDPSLFSLDLAQWIYGPIRNKESFYQGIVLRLRNLVEKMDSLDEKTARFVERFCHWTYTGPDLLKAMSNWMREHMSAKQVASHSSKKPDELIRDLHAHWSSKPSFQGETFQDYRPYDPRYLGDTPSYLFRIKNTQIIRTPAVTRDEKRSFFGNLIQAAVVEEFQGFLRYYQRQKKKHLYVNLMASNGSEKKRNLALEELEKKMPSTLHLVTLSKDCLFYHQKGPFSQQNDAESFKKTFLQQMFGDNPAFHWPISWNLDIAKETCQQAIDEVHEKYFSSTLLLTREQRCNFIELAYTEIINTLIHATNPTTCNISCRSCVDRGAANLSLLYARTQPLQNPQSRETLATITLAPAMIAQSRQMLPSRMNRLLPALAQELAFKGLKELS